MEIEKYADEANHAYSNLQELDEYKQAKVSMFAHVLKNPLNILKNIPVYEDRLEKNQSLTRPRDRYLTW